MEDRSTLLNQLQIDREDRVETGNHRWLLWVLLPILLGAAGIGAWWFGYGFATPALISVATAEPASTEATVTRGSILDASGYVVPRRQATVSSKITGKVVSVLIEEGQLVEQDEVVAYLDDTNFRADVARARAQLEHAEATLRAAEVAFNNAQPTYERVEQQFERSVVSAQDLDTARAAFDTARTNVDVAAHAVGVSRAALAVAERNLEDTVVRAPFPGVVTVKAAQEGEMVSPVSAGGGFTRTGIGTIVDMDSLEVQVDVSENFINRVHPGQDVTVRLNAYPDWAIPARVIAIIPTADRARATVRVRVALEERDERVLPQMGVRVAFLPGDRGTASAARPAGSAVIVPANAVRPSGDTGVVFIVSDGIVERRAVRLGARTDQGQVVIAGLTAGQQLAIGDLSELTDGGRVRIRN